MIKLLKRTLPLVLGIGAGIVFIRVWSHFHSASLIFPSAQEIPDEKPPHIAIVFGAAVWEGKAPSPILYDRVKTASELYLSGKVKKLLLSGDNRVEHYDEPAVMKRTALEMGVPEAAIVLDEVGRRTYDTCYRAKEIFGIQRALLVTQSFHLDRALYMCRALGINSIGIRAEKRPYVRETRWRLRELVATFKGWLDLHFLHPKVIMGEKQPIEGD